MNSDHDPREESTSIKRIPEGFRAIVMYGLSKKEALEVMKAVKALPEMGDTAFAMTTDTNIEWPLGQLVFELSEEHKMMKGWQPKSSDQSRQ